MKKYPQDTLTTAEITEIVEKLKKQPENHHFGKKLGELFLGDYFAKDQHFDLLKLEKAPKVDDDSPAQKVILINGFLNNKTKIFEDWLEAYNDIPDNVELYGLTWDSKEINDFIKSFVAPSAAATTLLRRTPWTMVAYGLATNPWHVSMKKAEDAGEMLGEILQQTQDSYSLVGHSLGCRVIYYTAESLLQQPEKKLHNLYLLGGAVGNQTEDWEKIADHITGNIYNCYSKNDDTLRYGYKIANAGLSKAIGYYRIDSKHPRIHNIDCTEIIAGHDKWKENYPDVYRLITQQLS
ncbi:DUF726 domain-containing protein [Ignatzschineria larvae DSM 13226]|uniref:DUF726 domain-containing protein n=1 Tax=Ignatzschineria larvae DSM 13226 TaxID=1111732 RepID=A0ABZ3BWN2_9GAMM|nr:DUF726 domain-containing protein [Ignatzschineria larvae]